MGVPGGSRLLITSLHISSWIVKGSMNFLITLLCKIYKNLSIE